MSRPKKMKEQSSASTEPPMEAKKSYKNRASLEKHERIKTPSLSSSNCVGGTLLKRIEEKKSKNAYGRCARVWVAKYHCHLCALQPATMPLRTCRCVWVRVYVCYSVYKKSRDDVIIYILEIYIYTGHIETVARYRREIERISKSLWCFLPHKFIRELDFLPLKFW